jgi:DNA polymerase-3 subunit delta
MEYKSDKDIINDLKNGKTHPVYFLAGEESFYIDKVVDYMQNNILSETEKEFDLSVLYGDDLTMEAVVDTAKQFPMFSKRQVVIVKEAQLIKRVDSLVHYVDKPLDSTILVLVYRKLMDKRTKLFKTIKSKGAYFESNRLRDYQIANWIEGYVREKGCTIDTRSAVMMADFLGTDLSKIVNEVDKLLITLPAGGKSITASHIERNIGLSKDFNNFELQDALTEKNVLKANRIIDYFSKNPNKNPLTLTLSVLYGFFSNLMVIHYMQDRSQQNVASALKVHPFVAKKQLMALRSYSAIQVFGIIALIREYDARSKGFGNSSVTHGELLKELVFKMMH